MGVCNYLHTFQEKTNEIFRVFEFIEAYINDLVIVTKGDWSHHLEKLELTLENFKTAGLGVISIIHFLDKHMWNI